MWVFARNFPKPKTQCGNFGTLLVAHEIRKCWHVNRSPCWLLLLHNLESPILDVRNIPEKCWHVNRALCWLLLLHDLEPPILGVRNIPEKQYETVPAAIVPAISLDRWTQTLESHQTLFWPGFRTSNPFLLGCMHLYNFAIDSLLAIPNTGCSQTCKNR